MKEALNSAPSLPLADLHRPDAISAWWPLAPGWWLLLFLGVTLAAIAVVLFLQHRRRNKYRKLATKTLNTLKDQQLDDSQLAQQCSQILKRTVLTAYGKSAANISGSHWQQFLTDSAGLSQQDQNCLQRLEEQRFRADCQLNQAELIATCERYIRQHKRRYKPVFGGCND
ncbi:uncharacterized protein DUF4381 [Sinobacterium caligoides]|uniref:Uncharacterized protein DUF4381 n=1 Tax=Sinobacterium caligoides TaxID=933926 RepID=A0A3N2DYS7_9GAMM|nr:DUF4381 domain-containing protein [Sinobacterium caligoides]ROS05003.1 uncharacterized protein DUF4381 [Sinobacterium caligoides]